MKFAKELEDDLVPEWRAKYINYKQGKKKIKHISKALRNANKTPKISGRPHLTHTDSAASIPYTHYDFTSRTERKSKYGTQTRSPGQIGGNGGGDPSPEQQYAIARRMSTTMFSTSPPIQDPISRADSSSDEDDDDDSEPEDEEITPLKRTVSGRSEHGKPVSYGSFSPPPKDAAKASDSQPGRDMPRLSLPDPALDPGRERIQTSELPPLSQQRSISERDGRGLRLSEAERPENKKHHSHPLMKQIALKQIEQQKSLPQTSPPNKPTAKDRWRKMFRARQINSPNVTTSQQNAYNELDARQDDFFNFLDKELDKVEKFYKLKEDEARDRLNVLRAQLHEHRDQRARDMKAEQHGHKTLRTRDDQVNNALAETPFPTDAHKDVFKQAQNGNLLGRVFKGENKIGKTSKAMENLASPPTSPQTQANNAKRDYTRKKTPVGNESVPHKFAKRRLKLALQEFYRGMELLKSYALLNRTGFRKINKKYDKAVNARPPLRYLNEKVSQAHFVKSTLIDEYLVAVEDLYARYFYRGNRKVAAQRLRSKIRSGDYAAASFRNGIWIAGGTGLAVAGLYNAGKTLFHDPSEDVRTTTAYLLQMYAGYFLALLLFLLFVLACKIWSKAHINYIFVFEYDTRHVLDWRQLAEIPCFFLFLNGFFVWLNFELGPLHGMYQYWPIALFSLTLIVMCLPFKILYYHSRKWWGFSNFRLLFAGLYPVEFRDFFLGDMYCSETYAMSQIEVFFCVYRWNWMEPPRCNSNHSRLLGFLTTLPAIWRFLQCIRRYYDSGNWFPHLANCAKYTGNILYYMTLSLYRLHVNTDSARTYKIIFIVFAALNGLYCSFWDIFMDWSLGNFFSKHRGLRDHLAYRRPWIYWVAIAFNIILRHQWIVYPIFVEDVQHSSAASFFVALAEVLRRGVWMLFRVENEHTNNVASFRASRDIPLPYSLPHSPKPDQRPNQEDSSQPGQQIRQRKTAVSDAAAREPNTAGTTGTDYDLERQPTNTSTSSIRRRVSNTPALRALQRVGTVIAAAHSQDFQKKRRPEVVGDSPHDETMLKSEPDDSSDDDDDDDEHVIEGSEFDPDEQEQRERREAQAAADQESADKKKKQKDTAEEHDDGGEGSSSSSDSNGAGRGGAGDVQSDSDIEAARNLVEQYHPETGLRGGGKKDKEA